MNSGIKPFSALAYTLVVSAGEQPVDKHRAWIGGLPGKFRQHFLFHYTTGWKCRVRLRTLATAQKSRVGKRFYCLPTLLNFKHQVSKAEALADTRHVDVVARVVDPAGGAGAQVDGFVLGVAG